MPVLRVIFFRHAANRFEAAARQIGADQAGGKMPKRKILPADFIAGRSAFLSEQARYDWIMDQAAVGGVDLPRPPFTEEESEQVAARVYDYVWEQRNAGTSVFAA